MSPVPVLVQRKINDFCIKFPTQKFFLVLLLDGKDCYVEDSSDNAIGFNKCTQDWWKDNKEQLSRSEFRLFEYCEYLSPNQRITEVTQSYKTGRAWRVKKDKPAKANTRTAKSKTSKRRKK
jgi:hypothetical protein